MDKSNFFTPMKALFLSPLFVVVLSIASDKVIAHPGGLNSAGCHNNRRTGDYHCHGGGYSGGRSSGGGGGYSIPAPQPVCQDVTKNATDVTLVMTDDRRKQSSNVFVTKVTAKLEGVSGNLFSYVVDGLAVRNFVVSSRTSGKFSFVSPLGSLL